MDLDLAIRGGTVVTASDTIRCDVGIKGERIVVLGENLRASREIDATGLLVLPGGIDSHVHIAQPSGPGIRWRRLCLRNAQRGGRQHHGAALRVAAARAILARGGGQLSQGSRGHCLCDYGFHLIITDPTPSVVSQELPRLLPMAIPRSRSS